ncbi:hypothetical protein BK767_01870 [Bacillus thuringiensis serovar kyushuensis]|uniref:hypothetical protein n=2 Tax=Bacillus thuringiensis TaxID=1428 RepID=UPI000B43BAF4|nr:hypothetical protein [Bacillus thuringiensis]MEC2866937.1 hypothetical protein [Bacillus cereus]OTZ79492.1 hypothetical protein BK767_01870 [Bacillus thuringiensis serovar kyushuensis]OTZ79994.1 hypothetical protein BK768_05890 [Bacillus thuringiensis serovar tohokuensis]
MTKLDQLKTDAEACIKAIIRKNYPNVRLGTFSYEGNIATIKETKDDYPEQLYADGYHYHVDVKPYYNETDSPKSISIPVVAPENNERTVTKTVTYSTGKSEKTSFNLFAKLAAKLNILPGSVVGPSGEISSTANIDLSEKIEATTNITTEQKSTTRAQTYPDFTDLLEANTDADYTVAFFKAEHTFTVKTTTEITGTKYVYGETYSSADTKNVSNAFASMRFTLPDKPSENRVMVITAADLALTGLSGYSKKTEYSRKPGNTNPTLVFAGEEEITITQKDIPRVYKQNVRPHNGHRNYSDLYQEIKVYSPNEFGEYEEDTYLMNSSIRKRPDILFE